MELLRISTGIYQINTWIIPAGEGKALIVDPAACRLSGDENAILDFLKKKNLEPLGILLTHCHYDHVAGTYAIKNAFPECKIAVHADDAVYCGASAFETQGQMLIEMGMEDFAPALKNLPQPDILLKGGETLDQVFNTDSKEISDSLKKWKVIHTPGHTAGGVCYYNQEYKVLISGDTVFYGTYGRTDLPGGDYSQMMKTLSMIKNKIPEDTKVFPGHDHFGFALGENF